jgi:hypothetical protein
MLRLTIAIVIIMNDVDEMFIAIIEFIELIQTIVDGLAY